MTQFTDLALQFLDPILLGARKTAALSAITFASAAVSLPPFAAMPFLAASVGMRWWTFAIAGTLGRWARFWAVMAVPGLLPPGLFGI